MRTSPSARRSRLLRGLALVSLIAITASAALGAQFRRSFGVERVATAADFDGKFHFCRLVYQASSNGTGGSWRTDFPDADINMSIRLSELTRIDVSFSGARAPNHLLVRPSDDALFQCPLVIMTAPGSAYFDDLDVARLRDFLAKGGFLWADDFWGTYQWEEWEAQIRRVLPANAYPIVDLPLDHPMLRAQFVVTDIPQIPNIGHYRRTGGGTSEQGSDSAVPRARMITDGQGRMMVFMTHNTDISDAWEREGEDPSYFVAFSPRGYALGINVILYALTH